MKKIIVLTGLITLLAHTALPGQNAPVATIGSVETVGNSARIEVTAADMTNIAGFNLDITYDPAVAAAVAVMPGPQLGGNMNVNLSLPGRILIGWYSSPAVTLAGTAELFTITFSRAGGGLTPLTWKDDGYSCIYYDGSFNPLNDLPAADFYVNGVLHFLPDTAPVISVNSVGACPDDTAHAAVAVVGFRDIGRFRLTLLYDPSSTDYLNFTGHPGYPGLSVSQGSPGVLVVKGQVTAGYSGITLTDSAVLFTLHFRIRGNASPVTWHTEDDSCSFHGPPPDYNLLKDLPEQAHYLSGTVFSELPGAAGIISGPAGGLVSRGETGIRFFLQPVPGAEGYHWTLPDDMIVTGGEGTNDITVTAGSTFRQGDVYTRAVSHCGDGAVSPRFHVTDTATLGLPDTGYDMASTCQVVARGFPNPFSGVVTIAYDQPCRGKVQLVISDMLGNQLLNTETPDESAGKHEFDFSPGLKSSGVFFAIITLSTSTGVYQQTIKLICHG